MIRDLLSRSRFTEAANVARALLARAESASGPNALEVAEVLDLLCEASRRSSTASEDPTALAERAVAIKERILGPNHPELATSLMNLAVERALSGTPAAARPILERAIAIREAALGPVHPLVASSLESLAGLLMALQDDDEAKRVIDRVLRIRETTYGENHPETVRTIFNAGVYYASTNDYVGARTFFKRARALADNGSRGDFPTTFSSLTALSVVAGLSGDYAEAARLDKELLLIVEGAFGATDPRLRFPLDSMAQDLRDLGDYATAKDAAERSLAISERAFGPDHPAVAKSLHTLATVVAEMGDYARAMQLLERATRISEKVRFDPAPRSFGALQDVLRASDVTQADAQLFVSLVGFRESRYGPAHPAVGDTLSNLAALLSTADDYRRTRPVFEEALAAREKAVGPDHPDVAAIAVNLGDVLVQTGENAAARRLYERALSIRETSLGADHPKVADALARLARLDLSAGRYAEARPLLDRALSIQQRKLGGDHPDVAATLAILAELDVRRGATSEGLETAVRAEAIGREHVRLTTRTLAEHQAMAYASSRPSTLDLMLSLAARTPHDSHLTTEAWDAVIRARGIVLEEMASRRRSAIGSENGEIAQLADALASARQRLATAVVRGVRDDPPERYQRLLAEARRDKDRAERDLAEKSTRFRANQSLSRLGLRDVSAALPAYCALVGFVSYNQMNLQPAGANATESRAVGLSYLAFVLRSDGSVPSVVPLGSAAAIEGLILGWRQSLNLESMAGGTASKSGEASYRRVAGLLRQRVWDPLRDHLSNVTRVFVVPDGALNLVSLSALPTGESGYLLETGPVLHYLSAERDLVPAEEGGSIGQGLLAMGSPAFDEHTSAAGVGSEASFRGPRSACSDFQSMRFDPLPASSKEVNRVVALWDKSRSTPDSLLLTGAAASESAFKAEAGGRRVLHAATHGFFLGGGCGSTSGRSASSPPSGVPAAVAAENPLLLSGLILAGANHRDEAGPGEDDGVLTAEEIASLDLNGVEWAVLSACDTGVGQIKAGEGVFGLQRAFQIAGVRTVIMSLWAVEDRATSDWMTGLYHQRFVKGLSTVDAVHAASLGLLRRRRAAGLDTHPFYWAGFVAVGDWH
jgi:CHAT domain-containing protein/tetratricopeptide (TPR) repeat protein